MKCSEITHRMKLYFNSLICIKDANHSNVWVVVISEVILAGKQEAAKSKLLTGLLTENRLFDPALSELSIFKR